MRSCRIAALLALCLVVLSGCFNAPSSTLKSAPHYLTLSEIPGVTDAEIAAANEVMQRHDSFVYGVNLTNEAFVQDDGSIGGFAALFCERLTELFGIPFTPVLYSWDELITGLQQGEIDFTGELTPTPERREIYRMTDPIIQREIKIYYNADAVNLQDIAKSRTIKCAFLDGSNTYNIVEENWNQPHEAVFYKDEYTIAEALRAGEIDAYIEESISDVLFESNEYDMIKSEDFYPLIYSPVSMTAFDSELEPIIAIINKFLRSGGDNELADMYNAGLNSHKQNVLWTRLTQAEKEYIASHNSDDTAVVFGVDSDNYPAAFYNSKSKQYQGISIDILSDISKLTGLKFAPGSKSPEDWVGILANLESGKYSFVTELIKSEHRQGRFLWTDEPYCEDNYALVSKADYPYLDINQVLYAKVGVIEGTAYADVFAEWFPSKINVHTYKTTEEAYRALNSNEIDLLMASQNLLLHITNFMEIPGYKANIVFNYASDSYFGFNIEEKTLSSIINKAQKLIDTEDLSQRWKRKVFDYDNKLLTDMMPYFLVAVIILVVIFVIVCVLLVKNRRLNKNLEKQRAVLEIEVEKRTENLQQQDAMLLSVNDIAKKLLSYDGTVNFDELISDCLKIIGEVTRQNRVYVWKDFVSKDGVACCSQVYEITNGVSSVQNMEELELVPYETLPNFLKALKNGTCLNSLVADLHETERSILEPQGIKSILIAPIRINNENWGFIGIDDCENYVTFTDLEENMLQMSGFLVASAITRKQTQDDMREMEERANLMLNSTPIGCSLLDVNLNFIDCNDALVKMFDLSSRQEFITRFLELSPPYLPDGRLTPVVMREILQKAANAGYLRFEWTHQKLNGEQIPVEITLVKIKYKNSHILAAYLRDLREFKAMLSEITQAEENLRIARDEALANSKAKTEFLAKMSHEIRTPMNAIVGMSELVLREQIPPAAREHILEIKQAGANLLSIINDILDLTKIESGKMEIIESDYIFTSLINDVVSIIRIRVMDKPLLFAANIDSNLPNLLFGDEIRVRQILLNLLSNAVKYTKEGHIIFNVSGEIADDNTVNLRFEIIDTGIGIKEEDIAGLFGEFVQVDINKNKGVEGTGLGLAITRNLCKAMGGDVTVSSVYGEGSVFTATLPQGYTSQEQLAEVQDPQSHNVLIYEPRNVYAQSLTQTLTNLNVRCSSVATQSEYHEAIKQNQYDYVLTPSFLYDTANDTLTNLGITAQLVVLVGYGETTVHPDIRSIAMPAYCVSIANLLNNTSDSGYNEDTDIHFTAPSAKILIVDDISTNLKVAEGLMAPYQMQIDLCESGIEAIELVKQNKYDIVFMDHMMPQMNGIDATIAIRAIDMESCKNAIIIALTANAVSGMKEMFLSNGFNDFLAKPIEIKKLNEILDKWIPKEKKQKYVAKENSGAEQIFEIENVDVSHGVAMTGGTVDNYLKILATFHKDGAAKLRDLSDCLRSGDIQLYTTHVHALKSALGSIGARDLSDKAKALEYAGKREDTSFIQSNNAAFIDSLTSLLQNISYVIAADDKSGGTIEGDTLFDELTKLRESLDSMDTVTAHQIINTLSSMNLDQSASAAIDQIAEHILMSDFDEAIEIIDSMLSEANA